jgi:hypothetical protein
MEQSAQRIEKQDSGTVSWREGMLEPGITAAGLDISVATQKATTTHGESLNFFLGLFIVLPVTKTVLYLLKESLICIFYL